MTHRKACIRHSKKRAMERFNIALSNKDLKEMAAMCQHQHQSTVIEYLSNTRARKHIIFKGQEFDVIYSNSTKCIVTILPEEDPELYIDYEEPFEFDL